MWWVIDWFTGGVIGWESLIGSSVGAILGHCLGPLSWATVLGYTWSPHRTCGNTFWQHIWVTSFGNILGHCLGPSAGAIGWGHRLGPSAWTTAGIIGLDNG